MSATRPHFVVRRARPADAAALAALAESTFREAFAAVNTAEDMELHCRTTYGETIQAAEIADPQRLTLLCLPANAASGREAIAGYAQLRWGTPPAGVVAQSPGEIQRIYVDGAWHGRGLAQVLMQACIDELRARGGDVAWLGVWERNPRAIAFYRKSGFEIVGEQVFKLGNDPQRDVVMARPIGG